MPKVTENTPPYCQFIRGTASKFGLGIDPINARKAGFADNPLWQKTTHEFNSGNEEEVYLTRQPRMVVLNRSKTMMTDNGRDIYLYDREECKGYKAFSYWVIWFVDNENRPLSRLPFRLRCTGYQGTSLMKLYDYPNEENTFCDHVIDIYQRKARNPQIANKELFLAHAVYQPNLVREMKAPKSNPQHGSMTVIARDFLIPTAENFSSLIIKNGSLESQWISKFIADTKPWLKENLIKQLESSQV